MLTPENISLRPINIVLQNYHPGPVYGVSFFITKGGECVFICCTEQIFKGDRGNWVGSRIVYSQQSRLERRFKAIIESTGDYLSEKGYWGPVGIDIIDSTASSHCGNDDRATGTIDQGPWIVDLNVRMGSSAPLGSLRSHFTSRGYDCATLLMLKFEKMSRMEFWRRMEDQEDQERLVIIAWFKYLNEGTMMSQARIVIAGRDVQHKNTLVNKVKALAI